jgi:hypothetical protein
MLNLALNGLSFIGFINADNSLLPLVAAALLVDAGIVAIWYFLGVLLNNGSVKAGAKSEFNQFLGSIIITAIILAGLFFYGNTMYNALNTTTLMSAKSMNTMCANIMQYNNPTLFTIAPHSLSLLAPSNSLLSGTGSNANANTNQPTFPGLCNMLSPTTIDGYIDYPLAATSVILANLTNQTAVNLNEFYDITTFLTWQSSVKPYVSITGGVQAGAAGAVAGAAAKITFTLYLQFQPYLGFAGSLGRTYRALGNLMTLEFIALISQLVIYSAFLYIWPFLLFAGLILRSVIFTRKVGGLLLAFAIGGLIFLPLTYSIEYLSLANGVPNYTNLQSAYGFNSIAPIPNSTGNIITPYQLNFFIPPTVQGIADYAGCRNTAAFLSEEFIDIVGLQTPVGGVKYFTGQLLSMMHRTPANYQPTYLIISCSSNAVLTFIYESYNIYGIISIVGWMLPLLNLAIAFAGIRAISGLMGGDTSIAGLSKLV